MDIAGLHLLFAPTPPGHPYRRITVTELSPQPLRLLRLAAETNPATFHSPAQPLPTTAYP